MLRVLLHKVQGDQLICEWRQTADEELGLKCRHWNGNRTTEAQSYYKYILLTATSQLLIYCLHLSQCADKVTVILPDSSHFYHITYLDFSKSGSHSFSVFLNLSNRRLFLLFFVFHVTTVDACLCLSVVNCFL